MTKKPPEKMLVGELSVGELEEAIRRHNRLYFEKLRPEITDYEFDKLVERLRRIRPDSPLLAGIPAERTVKGFRKVRHLSPMLSLDKCYRHEDLNEWASKCEGEIIATPKIDGCATELRYDGGGNLVLAATRGDGMEGDDITANARMIGDIPHKLPPLPPPYKGGGQGGVEIRGEIYMRLSVFEKYKAGFANPRNLAAGAIKQKDPSRTREYNLSFFGYDVLGLPLKTEREKIRLLRSFGIQTVEAMEIKNDGDEMRKAFEYFLSKRDARDYETDGVVFKADLVPEQERLGQTAHHPRFAIAWKFQGDSGTTTLSDLEWSVSRTGVITPIGVVEPVLLSGATVTRVSLHNLGLMKKMDLRKGAKVLMMRRGGVIPNLESVIEPDGGRRFAPPDLCPSCGARTEIRDDFLYCSDKSGCRKAKMEELRHFIRTIECDGFGEKLIEGLYDNGFVKDPADFFALKKEDLLELERMGEVLATKLIGNLHAKRDLPLDLFLRSLGIRELARHTSKVLVKEFGTLGRILKVSEEELSVIHTIGPVIAKEVTEGLKKKGELIGKLLRYVTITGTPVTRTGKKFLFTGALLAMERREAERLVEEKGGEIAAGVTKDLDYLVVGEGGGAGGKLEKAEKLRAKGGKIKILTEEEWKRMMGID